MKRRDLLKTAMIAPWIGSEQTAHTVLTNALGLRMATDSRDRIRWKRASDQSLFGTVFCDGRPLLRPTAPAGLLEAECRLWEDESDRGALLGTGRDHVVHGPVRLTLHHRLIDSGAGHGDDTLEARLQVHNTSNRALQVEVAFRTAAQPDPRATPDHLHLPLTAASLNSRRFAELRGPSFLSDCHQTVDRKPFTCHYLEPMAAYPDEMTTTALVLAPVVDSSAAGTPWHVALMAPSDQPCRFRRTIEAGGPIWRMGRVVELAPGQAVTLRCWLLVHTGDPRRAWQVFHQVAHHEDHPPIDWLRNFRVHYYDFLSSARGKAGRRGDGFEADLPYFSAFHVGLATQHGYFPTLGDYIHPDRKQWLAMRGDRHGPVEMSLEKMKHRIAAARKTGAKAGVYMHPVLFDDATPFFDAFKDVVQVDASGQRLRYPWNGPDTAGRNWRASLAAPAWREHLLRQAQWIMEILQPDAIVVDETFGGIGYDHHPDRKGPISRAAIDFYRKLRHLVRSFGPDRAVLASDCSMTGFVLWFDGEAGDHAYPGSLGNPLYRQEPVRYLAALGSKPWRPCAWHFRRMWAHQMALARQVGAGVGVSNGWLEYTGLHGLSDEQRRALIQDIESLG